MPRIWADTIDAHRHLVSDAVLDAAAALAAEAGPMSVSMSAVAQRAGIGRATLYKYFPDVESILLAWHRRTFGAGLDHLQAMADDPDLPLEALVDFAVRQRRHLHQHSETISAIASALASPHEMPDDVTTAVAAALGAAIVGLAARGEVRADVDAASAAGWLLHQVHAPGVVSDADLAVLVHAALAPDASV